jgi:Asp-tRNA(Asn)/Glu-tRNA(Gln) amidotransferase A subunit family amidase
MGRSRTGLPRAVQLLGPADSEPLLLRGGRALEVRGDRARLGRAHVVEFEWPTKR